MICLKAERKQRQEMRLLEKILEDENIHQAFKRVYANKGASGVDSVSVFELEEYLKQNWTSIKREIQVRAYKPQPVRRVEIPKPNGGVRKLGIPTVIDRVIEQAITQVLSPIWEPLFSDQSYGFRPGRCCQNAIVKVTEYLNSGFEWIVDIDLAKFFDSVPQDKLMSYIHEVIDDSDTESLIRKYLKAGVMIGEKYEETRMGTPQGGNLSPLLSNIILDKLDKELEFRGLHFTRYADDCIIAVKSRASANRVMNSITIWIEKKLGLKVNVTKTHITAPTKLKYLGFSFWKDFKTKEWKPRPHKSSIEKFKHKLKVLCCRKWSVGLTYRIKKLNEAIRGWINYYSIGTMKSYMSIIDSHLRTMIKIVIWKQWKLPSKRQRGLQKLGIEKDLARLTSYCGDRYQFVATKTCVSRAISKKILTRRGLVSCLDYYLAAYNSKQCRTA